MSKISDHTQVQAKLKEISEFISDRGDDIIQQQLLDAQFVDAVACPGLIDIVSVPNPKDKRLVKQSIDPRPLIKLVERLKQIIDSNLRMSKRVAKRIYLFDD